MTSMKQIHEIIRLNWLGFNEEIDFYIGARKKLKPVLTENLETLNTTINTLHSPFILFMPLMHISITIHSLLDRARLSINTK